MTRMLVIASMLSLCACAGTTDPGARMVQGMEGGAAMGCAMGALMTIWTGPVAAVGCGMGAIAGAGMGIMLGEATAPNMYP